MIYVYIVSILTFFIEMRRNDPDSEKREIRRSKDSVAISEAEDAERENRDTGNFGAVAGGGREGQKSKESGRPEEESAESGGVREERGRERSESDESVHLLAEEQADFGVSRGERGSGDGVGTESELIRNLREEAVGSFLEIKRDLLEQYLELRSQVFRGQRTARVVSQLATANLFLMGLLNCVFGLVSANLLAVLISLYTMFISTAVLMLELSRKRRIRRVGAFVRTWFRFLDLSAGRGFVQILLCTISLYLTRSAYFSLMSVFVGLAGALNIAFGVLAASKLRKIVDILRYYGSKDLENLGLGLDLGLRGRTEICPSELENVQLDKEQDPEHKLKRVHRLFNALDEDGNGQIDQEDLYNGLKSLNLPFTVSKSEIEVIFDRFDKDSNNMISVQEFEHWFISNKCPYFIL